MELTAKEKLQKARISLQKDSPFFGYLVLNLNLRKNEDMGFSGGTAGVDKNGNLYFNPEFINNLTQAQVKTLLGHEVLHAALEQLGRIGERNKSAWNIAADIVVNNILYNDGFTRIEGILNPENNEIELKGGKVEHIKEKSTEEIYQEVWNILPKKEIRSYGPGSGNGDEDGDMPGGFDKHINPDNAKKNEKCQSSIGGEEDEDKDDRWKRLMTEASTYAKQRGELPGGIERKIDELFESQANWRQLLRRYINKAIPFDYTYSLPSRRSQSVGVYMPKVKREGLDIVVAIDTSGSIDEEELAKFVSELKGIINSFEGVGLTVLSLDTQVNNVSKIRHGNMRGLSDIELTGGGGTDMRKVTNWIKENKSRTKLVITFTDAYTPFPQAQSWSQLWIVSKDGQAIDKIPDHIEAVKLVN